MKKLEIFADKFSVACFILAGILLTYIWLAVNYQIFLRYFRIGSAPWVIESVTYAMLYVTFLASAWALKHDKHINMDVLSNRLGPRNRAILNTFNYFIATALWLVISIYSGYLTYTLIIGGEHLSTLLEPLKWMLVIVIPIGAFLLASQSLIKMIGYLQNWRTSTEQPYSNKEGGL